MLITINNIKWMDDQCHTIKKGVPTSLSVLDMFLPYRIQLGKNGLTPKSVDTITVYLHDRFGCFPETMDISVLAEE